MNIILIDTSYAIFYRYYATIKWFSFGNKEEYANYKNNENYDWFENKIFVEKYEKMFLESIIKLVKKKIFNSNNSKILFCLDTPKELLWRSKIQCNYKSNRILKTNDSYNIKLFFNYTCTIIIPNLIKNYKNINLIQQPNIEGDDIIGIICLYIKNNNLNHKIYLISSDADFYQLGYSNLFFLNFKTKKELQFSEDEAKYELNKKIIFGDKSDCIPSITKKRIKNKFELLEDSELLSQFLLNNPESKKQYESNQKMIDFNYIPKEYVNIITKKFVSLL